MKIYIIFENNEEEYDDYIDWILEIYKEKEKAEKRFIELIKTNKHVKDREVNLEEHYKDTEENCRANIGAYRLEQHEIIE
jgi:hypothetical protein